MLIALVVIIILQHTHVSKHQVVDLKCIQFLFAMELSVRLGENVLCSALLVDNAFHISIKGGWVTNCPNSLTL